MTSQDPTAKHSQIPKFASNQLYCSPLQLPESLSNILFPAQVFLSVHARLSADCWDRQLPVVWKWAAEGNWPWMMTASPWVSFHL